MLHAALLSLLLTAQAQPDNTKANRPGEITASSQKNGKHDLAITRDIRRSIVADKTLSTYAHNVKVITRDGHVTLKGPVHSAHEKAALEAKATEIAGAGKVTNQISLMPSTKKKTPTSSGKDE